MFTHTLSIRLRAALFASLFFVMAAVHSEPDSEPPSEPTQVSLIDGELTYVGGLTEEANRQLFALYERLTTKPTTLAITSEGGKTGIGIDLANWVYTHGLDVKVLKYCISSCANYVFPAGKRKLVSKTAVVGYHGNANSAYRQWKKNISVARKKKDWEKEFDPIADRMLAQLNGHARNEQAFMDKIGVGLSLSSLGQANRYQPMYKADSSLIGWTYTIEGFARMGVHNIVVLDPPWSPEPFSPTQRVMVLALE